MGPGHVGSIPLLATRLEQATAAEGIMRRAGYPELTLYGPARAQRVADSPNPATLNLATPARTAHVGPQQMSGAEWTQQCQARRVHPRPGRRG